MARKTNSFVENHCLMKFTFKIFITALLLLLMLFTFTINGIGMTTLKYIYKDFFINKIDVNIMIGSSSIARLNTQKNSQCQSWLNRGIGNAKIKDFKRYLSYSSLSMTPEKVLIYAGENDISDGVGLELTIKGYKELLLLLLEKFPFAKIYILPIKPSPARKKNWLDFQRLNNEISEFSENYPNIYFDKGLWLRLLHDQPKKFVKDGIHLTAAGYEDFVGSLEVGCN